MNDGTRRGLPYLLVGIAIILAGTVEFGYTLFRGLTHLTDGLTQFVAPGHVVIPIAKNGTYTIFLEAESVMNGQIYSTTESVAGLKCAAQRDGSEKKTVLRRPAASITYSVGGRSGRSVLEFEADQPGTYTLSCDYGEDSKGPKVVLAVGTGLGSKIGSIISSSLMAMFGGGALGAIFIVIAARKWKTRPTGLVP